MSLIPLPLRRRIVLIKAYKAVFDSPDGQVVLRDLVLYAGLFEAEPGSVEATNFRSGQRAAILHIIDALKYDETKLMEMVAERDRLDETGDQA